MSKKGGLGKGLGAIFGENPSPVPEAPQEPAKAEGAAEEVLIKKITANPYQPRRVFDEEKLEELASSCVRRARAMSWWPVSVVCVQQRWQA